MLAAAKIQTPQHLPPAITKVMLEVEQRAERKEGVIRMALLLEVIAAGAVNNRDLRNTASVAKMSQF